MLFVVILVLALISPPAHAGAEPARQVTVQARKKHGALEYRFFSRAFAELQSFQPPEPRLLDLWLQAVYTEMTEPERDAYMPQGWAVAVASKSVDTVVPIRRGGYFVLPELPLAYEEDGIIMLKDPSKRTRLTSVWALRLPEGPALSYGTFKNAMAELHGVQEKIPYLSLALWQEKRAKFDGIKACFLAPDRAILINGKPVQDATVGNCKVLRFDPAYPQDEDIIQFSGPLDIVTMVETSAYQSLH